MEQQPFQDLSWYRAATLAERVASLSRNNHTAPNDTIDLKLAEYRMQRWRSQSPFSSDDFFAQRLAADRLTEDAFFYLLGEHTESVGKRIPDRPDWLDKLAQAFSRSSLPSPDNAAVLTPELANGRQAMAGFLEIVRPLVRQGLERLNEGIEAFRSTQPALPFDSDTAIATLLGQLSEKLFAILSRTMVLELNVARLQGELTGDTAQERFQSFVQRLRHRDIALAILQEYPVMARQLVNCIDKWVAFNLEFLQHLCADWEAILATFSPDSDPGPLIDLNSAGDTHRNGRTVMIAKFRSGFKVVYKPRSVAIDVHFQELLRWLNECGEHPPFRTVKVLDRQSYGWIEFVRAEACHSAEEVERFYQRQGGYLALLYALEATDFHYENLIAAGEHPILIDLESLFHPHVREATTNQAGYLAGRIMRHSVLRIGLLPQRLWPTDESDGIDLSGLGAQPGQLTPHAVPDWEGPGTDEMRFVRKRVEMPGADNRPNLNGNDVNVLDYTEAIERGFIAIYRLLLHHREELLLATGPLAHFAEDEVRVILRPTRTYAMLLYEGFHPDVLRNALDQERHLDWLWKGIEHNPSLAQIVPAERDDLLNGDIPMFTTFPNSTALWDSRGRSYPDFFEESGLTLVQNRIKQLTTTDLERQLWFIRASIATLTMGAEMTVAAQADERPAPPLLTTKGQASVGREQLLATAGAIGAQLEMLALREANEVAWIGLTLVGERSWMLLPLGIDLYSGIPGVALFLAYLGEMTGESRYIELARDSLTAVQNQIEGVKKTLKEIGGFGGWGSIIYTFSHLATLWRDPALLAEAEALVGLLPEIVAEDEGLDIISGAAGCIGGLLALYHCRPSERTLAAAVQCGDHLIAHGQPMAEGIGWPTGLAPEKPLAGFSHGAAGIAWALLELFAVSGKERFRQTALDGIAYERTLFSPQAGNWPDLRELDLPGQTSASDDELRFMSTWCHGAPGIGMARLQMLRHFEDTQVRKEVDTALKTTLAEGFGVNHSLCHGDLGNLELLLQASEVLGELEWRDRAHQITAAILKSMETHGWLCGVPQGVQTPGLMTGLAGIGYGLLRLADPQRVPSVLLLEPPVLSDTW